MSDALNCPASHIPKKRIGTFLCCKLFPVSAPRYGALSVVEIFFLDSPLIPLILLNPLIPLRYFVFSAVNVAELSIRSNWLSRLLEIESGPRPVKE